MGLARKVDFNRLVRAEEEPWNWLTYSGDYAGRRYSRLKQIHFDNVRDLRVAWVFQTGMTGKFETTPLASPGSGIVFGLLTPGRVAPSGATNGIFRRGYRCAAVR